MMGQEMKVPQDTRIDRILKLRDSGQPLIALEFAREFQGQLLNTQVAEKARWVRDFIATTELALSDESEKELDLGTRGLNWDRVLMRCHDLAPKVIQQQPGKSDIQLKRFLANKVGREFGIPLQSGNSDRSRLYAIAAEAIEDVRLDESS